MNVARSLAFVKAISAAQTPAELGRQLVRLAEAFGFASVFGGLVPRARAPKKEIAPLVLVQHVPEGWASRYNDRGYLFKDPVFHRLQADSQPFSWADSYASCPSHADRKLVGGEAAEFGLTGGFVVPVVTLDERIAAVSYGGDRAALNPEDAGKLSFAATCAIGRFLQLHASSGAQQVRMAGTRMTISTRCKALILLSTVMSFPPRFQNGVYGRVGFG